ncbi:MAG: hypothetical protein KJ077_11085 [Anaerolineae bacterium]|nr:hypothetical protein [Anaerolineae bacterium]
MTEHIPPLRERRYRYTPLSRIFLSPHYRLREFCVHDLALLFGIANVPHQVGIERAKPMVLKLLEPAHSAFGELRILQGYVSAQLNEKRREMGMPAGETKGNRHWWDRDQHLGVNEPVCVDFCIRGREGDVAAQRELVEFYAWEGLPWESIMIYPNTSSIQIVYNPRSERQWFSLRLEYLEAGYPKSEFFQIRRVENIPWDLVHLSTVEALAEAKYRLKAAGELYYNRKKPGNRQPVLFTE